MHGSSGFNIGSSGADELVARRPDQEPPEFDITAMVDLVFMMNIYFLVTFVTAAAGLNLPAATHVTALDADKATILTLTRTLDGKSATLIIGDSDKGEPITDHTQQEQKIQQAIETAAKGAEKKTAVLIRAEKKVRLGDVFRISAAVPATTEAGDKITLHVAVMEKDK